MDNMLQMQILQEDTRGLFVPTSLQKLVIDIKKHVQILHSLPEDNKGKNNKTGKFVSFFHAHT